jgi:hypothetical protein
MKSTDAQIRRIQAEIDRQEACRRQIAKLERELKEADVAVRTCTETLILNLAEARGISLLTRLKSWPYSTACTCRNRRDSSVPRPR